MFSGSALVCTAFVAGALIVSVSPLNAETTYGVQPQTQKTAPLASGNNEGGSGPSDARGVMGVVGATPMVEKPITQPVSYVATAYSLRGRTASGRLVSKGLIAADPRVLPLGSRVRLEAGAYSGEYLVADTGTLIKGRRIDIWIPTGREAMRFGRRAVKLTVLSYGGKRKPAVAKLTK